MMDDIQRAEAALELTKKNTQEAPYPSELQALVEEVFYRPGWTCRLQHLDRGQGSEGLTLIITTVGYDTYHPDNGQTYRVNHYMLVPPAAYNKQNWQRWLFNQFLLVETHECMEFFKVGSQRPYAPHHGPGNDPYTVFERGSDVDARTMYTGEVKGPPVEFKTASADKEWIKGEKAPPRFADGAPVKKGGDQQ